MPLLMSSCVVVVVAMVAAINLSLPQLAGSSLRPSSTQLLWVVDAYILVFGCLLIPAGAFGDRVGRKGVLLAGLGVFAGGCFVAAAAPNVTTLLVGRVTSGVGAALVMPATLSLLLQVTPPARRGGAIATWTAATGAAGALGNLGGGLILQWLPWQGLFLVVAPLALALGVLVALVSPSGLREDAAADFLGAALLTGSVFAFLFAIIEGPESGWRSLLVVTSFGTAAALLIAFLARATRAEHPLLDPHMFRIRPLRTGSVGVFAVFFGLFALFFVNSQYLQYAKGYSPLATGVAILPLPIAMFAASKRSMKLVDRYGARRVVGSGMLLLVAGLLALSFADAATPYLPYAVSLAAVAVGMGLSVPKLSTDIVTSLPATRSGMGSGLNSAVREIGAAVGIAIVGTVLSGQFTRQLPEGLQDGHSSPAQTLRAASHLGADVHAQAVRAFTDAMATGFRVIGLAVLVGTAIVFRGMRSGAAGRASSPN
jgi:EmrB/QacA subfamily drug resistance transporter